MSTEHNFLFNHTDSEGAVTTVDAFDDGVLVNASSGGAFIPPVMIRNLIDALRSVEDEDWPAPDRGAADRRRAAEIAAFKTGTVPLELHVAWILRKHVGRGSYIPSTEAYACAEDIADAARPHIEAEVRATVSEEVERLRARTDADDQLISDMRTRIVAWEQALGVTILPTIDDPDPKPPTASIITTSTPLAEYRAQCQSGLLRDVAAELRASRATGGVEYVDATWLEDRALHIERAARGGASGE